jgi:flagellar biogenesis protein FliO
MLTVAFAELILNECFFVSQQLLKVIAMVLGLLYTTKKASSEIV